MDFTGQHVVITGGSSGIGRATAERIVACGGTVTLIARRRDALEAAVTVIDALGQDGPSAYRPGWGKADWIVADVGVQDALTAALDTAVMRHGPIDGLFLNAGTTGRFAPLADYDDAAFADVMRVNATSLFWALRHVLPAMTGRGRGAILVTGSLASERGMVGNPGYLASKHAALGIARAVAMEAAPHGVRCNVLHPGYIDTEMLANVPQDVLVHLAATVPQGRIGSAQEAGAVAAFLLSDLASHVTAQALAVDGGLLGTLRQ